MSFDGYEDEHLLVNEQHDQNDDGDDPVRGVVATQARRNESSILPTHQFWQLGLPLARWCLYVLHLCTFLLFTTPHMLDLYFCTSKICIGKVLEKVLYWIMYIVQYCIILS